MKPNLFIKSLMTIVISAFVAGCSQEETLGGNENAIHGEELKVVVNDLGFTNDDSQSRVTEGSEDSYATVFTEGDAMGIYIVDENVAIRKNLKAVKGEENLWTVAEKLYYYEGADYIAYFPYDESLSNADIKSEEDIVAYFDNNNKFTTDQSSLENYYACDLLTARVEAQEVSQGNTVEFTFSHERAMMEFVIPTYLFKTSDTADAYTYSAPLGLSLTIGEVEYKPRSMGNCVYRCIVKPSTNETLLSFEGKFTDAKNYVPVTFKASDIVLTANSCKKYNIKYTVVGDDSGLSEDETTDYKLSEYNIREIKVGDYYYSDGSICPKEFPANPEGCIGVIFSTKANNEPTLDETDGDTKCTHGYVLSLHNATGHATNLSSIWDYLMWSVAPTDLNALGLTTTTNVSELLLDMNGYNYTQILISNDVVDNGDNCLKQAILSYGAASNATAKYAAPLCTSGWFVPSVGQYVELIKNFGGSGEFNGATISDSNVYYVINGALQKVGGQIDGGNSSRNKFWSSNTSGSGDAFLLELTDKKYGIWPKIGTQKSYARIRPILAF